jgi:chaperonin GroES
MTKMQDDKIRHKIRAHIHELVPTLNRVLVEPLDAEEVTEGGLFIPQNAKSSSTVGLVVKCGPGNYNPNHDKYIEVPVKAGDVVIYGDYAGHTIEAGGQELKLLNETDIFGVIPSVFVEDEDDDAG